MATKKDSGIVNIHGKEYQTVAKRVQDFRKEHGDKYSIVTQVVSANDHDVVMYAAIKDEAKRVIATGHAEEIRSSSQINKTSALENAETSAIGRALAAFGMAGTEYASADEVANAIHQQNSQPADEPKQDADMLARAKAKINEELAAHGYDTAAAKQAFINQVLGKTVVSTLDEADLVMDALDNEEAS